jgi:hypothetical protein
MVRYDRNVLLVKFAPGGETSGYKLLANAGAELRRAPPGRVADWHTAPRRQYVITLSGHGELEISGGKKISVGPGSINLVEDVTGKGHITRTVGNEDRVTPARLNLNAVRRGRLPSPARATSPGRRLGPNLQCASAGDVDEVLIAR